VTLSVERSNLAIDFIDFRVVTQGVGLATLLPERVLFVLNGFF
jgi:hypothetical protein